MGPSGSGKTSLLRAIAGLWQCGKGSVRTYLQCCEKHPRSINLTEATTSSSQTFGEIEEENNMEHEYGQWNGSMIFFLPQSPFLVDGSLRQQLLYPTWTATSDQSNGIQNSFCHMHLGQYYNLDY
jgi:ABC-type uncharacterized transport system fused permease/ATPase subunit